MSPQEVFGAGEPLEVRKVCILDVDVLLVTRTVSRYTGGPWPNASRGEVTWDLERRDGFYDTPFSSLEWYLRTNTPHGHLLVLRVGFRVLAEPGQIDWS